MPVITLSPANNIGWNLANTSYDNKSINITDEFLNEVNGLAFSSDGDYMYVVGHSVTNNTPRVVRQYNLSTPWDVSTSSPLPQKIYSIPSLHLDGITFKPDGTEMYICYDTDRCTQHTLSTPWDIDTATDTGNLLQAPTLNSFVTGVQFKPDGTEVYLIFRSISASTHSIVRTFFLPTPWSLSTAFNPDAPIDLNRVFPFGLESDTQDIFFRNNGTLMYVPINDGSFTQYKIKQYTLTTAWDVTTAVDNGISFSYNITGVPSSAARTTGLAFKTDGRKMYLVNGTPGNEEVYQYSTP